MPLHCQESRGSNRAGHFPIAPPSPNVSHGRHQSRPLPGTRISDPIPRRSCAEHSFSLQRFSSLPCPPVHNAAVARVPAPVAAAEGAGQPRRRRFRSRPVRVPMR